MKIFVAGATGAIGLPLVRVLRALNHEVTGMTRAGAGADRLRELGARVSFADALHPQSVRDAIQAASPDVVIDQLTWLPANPADIIKSMPDDTRLHREGGGNLLAAAEALGVKRYIVQSRGFYLAAAPGKLADETAGLRRDAPGEIGESARVIAAYENSVMNSASLEGGSCAMVSSVAPAPGTDRTVPLQSRHGKEKCRSSVTAMQSGPSSISMMRSRRQWLR